MAEGGASEAYVSLATNNQYAYGAITLGRSLRDSGTQRRLALMITEQVTEEMRSSLRKIWDELIVIEELSSDDEENLALLRRPELGVTFSKLHAWRLEQYSKCVFLDADTLIVANVDELFEREELSAASDVGWPDLFNSGVFVYRPNQATFSALKDLAKQEGSYDGGDQGLLNTFWSDWATKDISRRLPFIYNVVATASYGYPPAFKRFKDDIKIIHFIGSVKPWHHLYLCNEDKVVLVRTSDQSQYGLVEYIKRWWQVYTSTLPKDESGPPVQHMSFSPSHFETTMPTEEGHRQAWERGQPDYHGTDQFDNIQAHLDRQLDQS